MDGLYFLLIRCSGIVSNTTCISSRLINVAHDLSITVFAYWGSALSMFLLLIEIFFMEMMTSEFIVEFNDSAHRAE